MDNNKFVLLGNFSDLEADIIESVLRQLDIPVMKKYPESGGYLEIYMGTSPFGVSLYVPESQLDKAMEIVENNVDEPDYEEMTGEEQEVTEEFESERDSSSLLGIFKFIAQVFIIGFFVYYLIKLLF